jgi:peptidoglycan/LPS O-acetylase OafA/YrhL
LPATASFSLKSTSSARDRPLLLSGTPIYEHPEFGQLVFFSAIIAKVCVAIFLILSGYGLAQSIQHKPMGLWSFYKKRFSYIYLNYWFIAILFVPLGIYYFNRPIAEVFGAYPYLKFFIQMLGYHMYFSDIGLGYNPTWWYISVLVGMYWIFPLVFKALKRYGLWSFIPALVILVLPQRSYFGISILYLWIFPFMLGIYLALHDGFCRMSTMLSKIGWVRYPVLVVLLVLLILFRLKLQGMNMIRIDAIFGTIIILLVFELTRQSAMLERGLAFLGEHLFNIFLFHTFIFYLYFKDFIYGFGQPVLIFLVLLVICIAISYMLELIKKLIGFQKIQSAIDKITIQDRLIIG